MLTGSEKVYKNERFSFDEGEYVCMFQTREKQDGLHCHDCIEINYVEDGVGTYIIDGRLYPIESGDIFVINNSEHHLAIHGDRPLTLTVLVLETSHLWKNRSGVDYLKPFMDRNSRFSNRITKGEQVHQSLLMQITELKEIYLQESAVPANQKQDVPEEDAVVGEATLDLLLALLYRYYKQKKELGAVSEDPAAEQRKASRQPSVERIIAYINSHFQEKITLEALAKESSLSQTYLSKYFKKTTGQTVSMYIQEMRVQYAGYLLQTSDLSISEVAMTSGFDSVSYFNRNFKMKYGMSPGEFRKIRQKN